MVVLDDRGRVIRPALLWNDTRSAPEAEELTGHFGATALASLTGSVPVAAFTSTKLLWLRNHEPDNAARVAAVALPHDWLSWRLAGYGPEGESERGPVLDALWTDRSDASGTGYFNPTSNTYCDEIIRFALGHVPKLPRLVLPGAYADETPSGVKIACGAGDNAAAAFGLGASDGDVIVSLGTSGTVFAVSSSSTHDESGTIAGFASASGSFLPLVCTLNAARVVDSVARLLQVTHDELSELALSAPSGSGGIVLVPYFEGERTPNLPGSQAELVGLTLENYTRENVARASIEGMLCGLHAGLRYLIDAGVICERIFLVGGAAANEAIQKVAAEIFGITVVVPEPGEYVAIGAARQAAEVLLGKTPTWDLASFTVAPSPRAQSTIENYGRAARIMAERYH
jgi:xylulokinase